MTIFGGYTGEFAESLRSAGFDVTFTDPLEHWTKRAEERGFDAHTCHAEVLPADLLRKTGVFATFECYQPFRGAQNIYTVLRFLTAPDGILFAESERTREELRDEIGPGMGSLKADFKPYSDTYDTQRRYRETDGLRFYHFYQDDTTRLDVARDAFILRALYESGIEGEPNAVDAAVVQRIAEATDARPDEVRAALWRAHGAYQALLPEPMQRHLPPTQLSIRSTPFRLEIQQKE